MRWSGYALAVGSALVFGWALVTSIRAALNVDPIGVAVWLAGVAAVCLVSVVLVTRYVMRRPHHGGWVLVAIVCLVATFVCVLSWLPLLAVQS